ncbi:FadR/GntR family transcriptional regulator [Rhodococcus koreensis]
MSQGAEFAPIQTMQAFERTVERLLVAMRLGFLTAGERRPLERELAEQVQVGRLTLRLAIRALQRGRYRGTFVTAASAQQVSHQCVSLVRSTRRELGNARSMQRVFEVGEGELATEFGDSPAEIKDLDWCLSGCEADSGRIARHRKDSRLHRAFAKMTGSPSFTSTSTAVRTRCTALLDAIAAVEWNVSNSHRQHGQITPIVVGDVTRARVMLKHVHGTETLLRGFRADEPDTPKEISEQTTAGIPGYVAYLIEEAHQE